MGVQLGISKRGTSDKACDQIADAVLMLCWRGIRMPGSSEVVASTGMVIVLGELSTTAYADIPQIVRNTVISVMPTAGPALMPIPVQC